MNSARLRLLFVIKSLSLTGGGAERVLTSVASELVTRGHEVAIASFDPGNSKDFYSLDPRVERQRLAIGDIHSTSGPIILFRKLLALRRLLGVQRPDVAVGFMHSAFVPLCGAALRTGVPVVASEHTAHAHYSKRPLQKLLILLGQPLCSAFTAPSDAVAAGFPGPVRRRMVPMPNPVTFGVDIGEVRNERPVILSVAGLRPEKGHATLINAFALVARSSDWDLRLVGDGPLREELERQVHKLGLQSRVVFRGSVADVTQEYASAGLFVVPSDYESFGLATAEALAAGLPAVGFADCLGTNEMIEDGVNGLLVAGADRAEALADGMAQLISSKELREELGRAGPASVAEYSLASVADRWERLLQSVLREPNSH
jgi:GalNAc-alpha-(1->4)-GalNAc-alpha-(1->3)-diNAcBac-PP-undecaprenol alpha-1,4-N-acetyl-D-galactosaminyltransferase